MKQLFQEFKQQTADLFVLTTPQRQRVRPVLHAIVWTTVGLLIVLFAANFIQMRILVGQIRETQQSNVLKAHAADELLRAVNDCVNIHGKCYKDGQHRTNNAVGSITVLATDASILAAGCADKPGTQTIKEVHECVNDGLQKLGYEVK